MRLKKVIFFGKKVLDDFRSLLEQRPLNFEVDQPLLQHYYFVFEEDFKKLNRLLSHFDENGVPLNKPYIDVEDSDFHYYPISIGQYALALFHSYLDTRNEEKKAHFLRIADWFVANGEAEEGRGRLWRTYVSKPEYKVDKGWPSAFAQSRAISVCLRAWQLTNENKYLEAARAALLSFGLDIDQGGVAIRRKEGFTFYEEYVATVPTRVLDGHLFALFGLYDYVRALREEQEGSGYKVAAQYFQDGIEGLKNSLPDYELGFWLRFNTCELPGYPLDDPCTIKYLKLVIDQLKLIAKMSGDDFFDKKAKEYKGYLKVKNILKMYQFKFKSLKKLNRL